MIIMGMVDTMRMVNTIGMLETAVDNQKQAAIINNNG